MHINGGKLKNYWSVTFHFNILNRGGIYANENLSSQYSSAVSSSLDVANTSLLTSVNREITNSFKFADLDQILFVVLLKIYPFSLRFAEPSNDACSKINSMIIPCCEDLIEPKSDHSHNIVEITNNTGKYLLDENLVSFMIQSALNKPRKMQRTRHYGWFYMTIGMLTLVQTGG